MAFPRAQTAGGSGWGPPLRFRLSRRTSGFVGGLVLLLGVVLIVDALITVLWEDPLTAVFTRKSKRRSRRSWRRRNRRRFHPPRSPS